MDTTDTPSPPRNRTSGCSGLLGRLRDEAGFTIVELLVATALLLAVSAPVTAVLLTGAKSANRSLSRSSADELAAAKIEIIRGMDYDNIGFPGGNPGGTVSSSSTPVLFSPSTLGGQAISISYQINYVDDHGAKTQTYADYKHVVVTITRTSDNTVLATKSTDVASLSGAVDGSLVSIRRSVVDMATGSPALSGVTMDLLSGPSAPREDTTNSSGGVIFPRLAVNTSTSNFYDVKATLSGYTTRPDDLAYTGTGNPAISFEHVNHLIGADDLQTIHMYKTGAVVTVKVNKSDGTSFPSAATVFMASAVTPLTTAGIVGTSASSSGTPNKATISSLFLDQKYISPAVTSISIFPGNYTFAAQSGTASSMTYTAPVTTNPLGSYPTNLTGTVTLAMYASACTSNTTVTVTVKRGSTAIQGAHVEMFSTATGVATAPNVYVWADTNSSGVATLIVPRGSGFTIRATDARGSTASLTNQSYAAATASATVTVTP